MNRSAITEFPFDLPGFDLLQEPGLAVRLTHALSLEPINKAFDAAGEILGCSAAAICLITSRKVTRNGKKVSVHSFQYKFSKEFNDLLKTTGAARFDQHVTGWNLPDDGGLTIAKVSSKFGDHFRAVVYVNNMSVMMSRTQTAFAPHQRVAFARLPFAIEVSARSVFQALSASRPQDRIIPGQLTVHSGESFEPIPDNGSVWTQMPFVLIGYDVENGAPRYASISTLGMAVEEVLFPTSRRKLYQAIARFRDACQTLSTPGFTASCAASLMERPGQRASFRGGFDRFSAQMALIGSRLPDFPLAPLCHDYVALTGGSVAVAPSHHGVDCVVPGNDEYLRRIASFFGCDASAQPIVFDRAALDDMASSSDGKFSAVIAHSLSHHIVGRWRSARNLDPAPRHDVEWACCVGILELLISGTFTAGLYLSYNPDHETANSIITSTLSETAKSMIRVQQVSAEPFSREKINEILMACRVEFEKYSHYVIGQSKILADLLRADDPTDAVHAVELSGSEGLTDREIKDLMAGDGLN